MTETRIGGDQSDFGATLWSVVLRAQDPAAPDRRAALDQLVRAYWKPVYFFVRRRGHDVETAKDYTQGFFAAFLEKDFLSAVDRSRGRFKSFVLAALQHFLSKEYDRERAIKRGGGVKTFALEFDGREIEPAHSETPEKAFARSWAAILVGRVMERYRSECRERGAEKAAEALKLHLDGKAYAEVSAALGVSVKDVTNWLHRGRQRLRELTEEEVRPTVASEDDLRQELRDILEML